MGTIDARLFHLGIPDMDADHTKLIAVANKVASIVEKPNFREVDFSTQLKALMAYSIEHFDREEAYMEKIRFPGLAEHKIQHRQVIDELDKIAASGTRGAKVALSLQLFMKVWLFEHISKHDAAYATFAKSG